MKILLINSPVAKPSPHSWLSPPLGLAYIASALIMEGHKVSAVDFNIGGLSYKIEDRITQGIKPVVAGISAYTETYSNALKIAGEIKAVDKDIQIVMGGPHSSVMPKQVLQNDSVDFVVMGEGEKTIVELVRHIEHGVGRLRDIKGLAYKDKGVVINEPREFLSPEESFYPARELFPLEFYPNTWNVLTARGGCPFKCPFCSASSLWHGRRKARSPERVLDEIRMLIQRYGTRYIFFSDDVFTLDRKWVFEILSGLRKLDYPLTWGCATRVDLVDRPMIAAMARAGCRSIQYGVESGSQKVLDSVKGIKKEQVLTMIRTSRDAGISVASSFMVPFPEDTPETLSESAEFIKRIYQVGSKVLLSYTTPYPGTYFYQKAEAIGIKILTNRWEEFDSKHNIMETKYLSGEDIEGFVNEIGQYQSVNLIWP